MVLNWILQKGMLSGYLQNSNEVLDKHRSVLAVDDTCREFTAPCIRFLMQNYLGPVGPHRAALDEHGVCAQAGQCFTLTDPCVFLE